MNITDIFKNIASTYSFLFLKVNGTRDDITIDVTFTDVFISVIFTSNWNNIFSARAYGLTGRTTHTGQHTQNNTQRAEQHTQNNTHRTTHSGQNNTHRTTHNGQNNTHRLSNV